MIKKASATVLIITFSILIVLDIFIGCFILVFKNDFGKAPFNQPGSEWASADGSIKIYEPNTPYAFMSISFGDEKHDYLIYFNSESYESFSAYSYSCYQFHKDDLKKLNVQEEKVYEIWDVDYKTLKAFSVTVKESTHFSKGQKIDFIRTKDGDTGKYWKTFVLKLFISLFPFSLAILKAFAIVFIVKKKFYPWQKYQFF